MWINLLNNLKILKSLNLNFNFKILKILNDINTFSHEGTLHFYPDEQVPGLGSYFVIKFSTQDRDIYSNAYDKDKDLAFLKACVELIERYVSYNNKYKDHELKFDLVDYSQYQQNQISISYINKHKQNKFKHAYSTIRNLRDNTNYNTYTSNIYYKLDSSQANNFDLTSNGIAAHTDKEKAILGSIYEVIERDAYLLYHLLKLSPFKIIDDELSERYKDVSDFFASKKITHIPLLLSTDISTSTVMILLSTYIDNEYRYTFGMAASGNLNDAIDSAYNEAIKNSKYLFLDKIKFRSNEDISLYERMTIARGHKYNITMEHWLSGESISLQQAKQLFTQNRSLNDILSNFPDLDIYIYEYKTNLKNVHVYRAIIPYLLNLYINERYKITSAKRIDVYLKQNNMPSRVLNQTPHMLA